MIEKFREEVYKQHDIVCNQKYNSYLPYSFHLKAVESQFSKMEYLLSSNEDVIIGRYAACAHDILEDARVTYNDLVYMVNDSYDKDSRDYDYIEDIGIKVADVVYCVTDEKGKDRQSRKNSKYYSELVSNDLAVFVKLSDLSANLLFSKLTNSSMLRLYKKEFPYMRDMLYKKEYSEFFDYIQGIINN